MANIKDATTGTFENEVLKSNDPVLIDFWAPWCGPCRMVAPVVEEIAKEYEGKVKVMKLNTDENMDIAIKYNILSIPTLGFFQGGQMVDRIIGAVPKKVIVEKIAKTFSNASAAKSN
jgi:thioredoxin 1